MDDEELRALLEKAQDSGSRKQSRHPRNGHPRLNRTSYIFTFFVSSNPPFETGEDLPSIPTACEAKAGADADDRLSMDLFYNVMRHKDSD